MRPVAKPYQASWRVVGTPEAGVVHVVGFVDIGVHACEKAWLKQIFFPFLLIFLSINGPQIAGIKAVSMTLFRNSRVHLLILLYFPLIYAFIL